MKFTITLDHVPATGDELAKLIEQVRWMVKYNFGPEPLRTTTGPVYDDPEVRSVRVGTWSIEAGVGSQPRSALFEQIAAIAKPPEGL